MKDLELMLELLEQKKTYFLHYEKEMEALPLLATEELEPCLERGAKIIKRLEELELRLSQLIQQNGPLVRSALNHQCDRYQLSPELGKLYDASLSVKAVASRILQNDEMIRQRIAAEREKALENIKEINSRSHVVAGKYHRSMQTGVTNFFPETQGKEI